MARKTRSSNARKSRANNRSLCVARRHVSDSEHRDRGSIPSRTHPARWSLRVLGRVGTAGWAIPKDVRDRFPSEGSTLERYAANFSCVEINSTFYRAHRESTYARWAASVPESFRFSVKVRKTLTHELRLANAHEPLARFLDEISRLGAKLGVTLFQLPPSFAFDALLVGRFFAEYRSLAAGATVCEPRHASWFTDDAHRLLDSFQIGRVAADPALPGGDRPAGDSAVRYFRWHGSPRRYYDRYGLERLTALARHAAPAATAWCIFDNTAAGAATADALAFKELQRP